MMKRAWMRVGGHHLRGRDSAGGVDLRWATNGFFFLFLEGGAAVLVSV